MNDEELKKELYLMIEDINNTKILNNLCVLIDDYVRYYSNRQKNVED